MDGYQSNIPKPKMTTPLVMIDRMGQGLRVLKSAGSRRPDTYVGLEIEKVTGDAWRAGVQSDDLLPAINNEPATSTELVSALAARA